MKHASILYLAHFIGVCSYSKIASQRAFRTSGVMTLSFLLFSAFFFWTLVMKSPKLAPHIKLSVAIRDVTAIFFVLKGLFCDEELSELFDIAFTYLKLYLVKKWSLKIVVVCLSYNLLLYFDLVLFSFDNVIYSVYFLSYEFLHRAIPLSTVMMFCICCVAVEAAYSKLQEDIRQIPSQVSVHYIAKLRLKQLDIVEFVTKINARFGFSIFIFVTHIQVSLLGRALHLTTLVLKEVYVLAVCIGASLSGTLLLAWYPLIKAGEACKKQEETLSVILDINTRSMNAYSMHQIQQMAKDIQCRPIVFSAAGCFDLNYSVVYSIVEVVYSYLLFIGPSEYNKLKSH